MKGLRCRLIPHHGMIYLFCSLFISLVLSLFSSVSVFAVDLSINVVDYQGTVKPSGGCHLETLTNQYNSSNCYFDFNETNVKRVDLINLNVTDGWYYQFDMTVVSERLNNTYDVSQIQIQPIDSLSSSWSIVSMEQVSDSQAMTGVNLGYNAISATYRIIAKAHETTSVSSLRFQGTYGNHTFLVRYPADNNSSFRTTVVIGQPRAYSLKDYSAQLNDIKNAINQMAQNSSMSGVIEQQQETNEKLDEQNERNQQIDDGLEQAQSDGDTNADSATSDAQSTGTTLLQAFIDMVGAITGASPSNCVINGNMGIGNFTLGNIDLCDLDPPPAFQVISSLVVIGLAVPLALSAYNRLVGLLRSFAT